MEYNILAKTDFFRLLDTVHCDGLQALQEAYHHFVGEVVTLCRSHARQAVFALSYAETELAFHQTVSVEESTDAVGVLVKKALAFIRKMQEHVAAVYHLHGEVATVPVDAAGAVETKPLVKWTGNAVDLVEMVYGICVMGSVNDGEVKFKELAQAMYQFFGVKAKDCYRFYTDIRRRKNYSRTYFLDKMQEKLNDKMRRDDELERMRR